MIKEAAAVVYDGITRLRNWGFCAGIIPVRRLPCPVISVGNIAVGGTGKTPTTLALAQFLQNMGFVPVILSRGYGRSTRGVYKVDASAKDAAQLFGDEPTLLARALGAQVGVFVGENRFAAGQEAYRLLSQSLNQQIIFILDDGFQHRFIYRDLDIVLLDADSILHETLQVFPRGAARENVKNGLQRADAVLITRAKTNQRATIETKLQALGFSKEYLFWGNVRLQSHLEGVQGARINADQLQGARVIAACGIGKPLQFTESLKQDLGVQIVDRVFWPDHFRPGIADWQKVEQLRFKNNADWVLITEKDRVKITATYGRTRLFEQTLVVAMDMFIESQDNWQKMILAKVQSRKE